MSDDTTKIRICSKCRINPARADQYYCTKCHSIAQREVRIRRKNEWKRLHNLIDQLTVHNATTEKHFKAKIKSRRIVVQELSGNIYAAEVVGFLPEDKLTVMTVDGEQRIVDLDQVMSEKHYVTREN